MQRRLATVIFLYSHDHGSSHDQKTLTLSVLTVHLMVPSWFIASLTTMPAGLGNMLMMLIASATYIALIYLEAWSWREWQNKGIQPTCSEFTSTEP